MAATAQPAYESDGGQQLVSETFEAGTGPVLYGPDGPVDADMMAPLQDYGMDSSPQPVEFSGINTRPAMATFNFPRNGVGGSGRFGGSGRGSGSGKASGSGKVSGSGRSGDMERGPGSGFGSGGHRCHDGINKDTGIAPRRCTDIQCCFGWLFFTIVLLTILCMARWYGDVNTLTHGRDYYGRVCGVSNGVENMPWLYWCRGDAPDVGPPSRIQIDYPVCVPACPTSYNTSANNRSNMVPCLHKASSTHSQIAGGQFGNVRTEVVTMMESVVYTAPYPTQPRGGRFCMPQDSKLRLTLLDDMQGLHPLGRLMRNVTAGALGHLRWVFFIVTLVAVLLGYFFVFCIRYCPKTMTVFFVYPAAFVTGAVAVFLFLSIVVLVNKDLDFSQTYMKQWNPLYLHYPSTNYATAWSLVLSVLIFAVTALLIGMGRNFDGNSVGELVNGAMECTNLVGGMYYLPAIEAFVKWLIFIFFLEGLRSFFTVGDLHKNRIHIDGVRLAGLSREWGWNHWWILCTVFWVVGFYWFMEMCNAFFEHLISKCTVVYYFTEKEDGEKVEVSSPLAGAAKEAILYHWGSIAYAGFWIPTWRPLRFLYWATSSLVPDQGSQTSLGKFLACFEMCDCCGLKDCCGAKQWAKEKIESEDALIKDGFSDVVIRANDFAPASAKAHVLLEHSHKVVQYMYRDQSQTTLCILGVTGIATVCAWVAFMILNFAQIYTDEASALYVQNPALVVFLSWIEGAYIAFGFMSAWDHTADTLLYCYAWNRKFQCKSVEKFIPESVRAIVGYDDKDEDEYPFYGRAKSNMYLRSWLPRSEKKRKAENEEKPEASWLTFNPADWLPMGSQAPRPRPAPQELQSLLSQD